MDIDGYVRVFRELLRADMEKNNLEVLPANYIDKAINENEQFVMLHRGDDEFKSKFPKIVRELETYFEVVQEQSKSVVAKDFKPWVKEIDEKKKIEWFYSERLKNFLAHQNIIGKQPLDRLWTDTRTILDYCGNPKEESFKRRGMVIGNVQMGKTTNYSMLLCRAADAGYKVIILLSGITNSLRKQTQERIDENFVGRISLKNQDITTGETLPIMRFGKKKSPSSFTDRMDDFKMQTTKNAATMGLLDNQKNEVIFVAKKNVRTLENIRDFLNLTIKTEKTDKLKYPVMLIDDEADNASVSTAKDQSRPTRINSLLREILSLCEKSTYIGYTATPFANIFIDADSWDEALKDDLFPHHFITALDYPSNYIGPHRLFNENGDLKDKCVREVSDYNDYISLDPPHKKDDFIPELPPSLEKSLRIFILARAIRIKSGYASNHSTMMVNVSRFNNVQDKVTELINQYIKHLKDHIESSGLSEQSPVMKEFRQDFEEEYKTNGNYEDILPLLSDAINPIEVLTVNGKGGALDYHDRMFKETGRHLIAVGGLALSRGLTLEGLIVSYVLRNSLASDTLLQMGRWFGYRKGYEDLCRVYLPLSSIRYYQDAEMQISELIKEVGTMNALDRTPQDFGLKVLESDLAIRITAANKMRSSKSLTISSSFYGSHVQGFTLHNNPTKRSSNLNIAEEFITDLGSPKSKEDCKFWDNVEGLRVVKFLEALDIPIADQKFGPLLKNNRSLVSEFIGSEITEKFARWDIALPHNKGKENSILFAGLHFSARGRGKGLFTKENGQKLWLATANRAIAGPNDVAILLTEQDKKEIIESKNEDVSDQRAYILNLDRPLLLLQLVNENSGDPKSLIEGLNISVSICFPEIENGERKTKTYSLNSVYQKQLDLFKDANDEDEEYILDEAN